MAVMTSITRETGRLIFNLQRDEETTTRAIDIPFPIVDTTQEGILEQLQTAINNVNASMTAADNEMNHFMQPANWRDDDQNEPTWVTTSVHYEIVKTTTTPITAETTEVSKG